MGWTLLYGIIGIVIVVVGVFLMVGSLNSLVPLSNLASWDFFNSNLFDGFLIMVIGWIIIALGAIASFFKINSEIISEEVNA